MGSITSKDNVCSKCQHNHSKHREHDNGDRCEPRDKCRGRTYVAFPSCECREKNYVLPDRGYDLPPFSPTSRLMATHKCNQCRPLCECKQCMCVLCVQKPDYFIKKIFARTTEV